MTRTFSAPLPPVESGYSGNIQVPSAIAIEFVDAGHRRVIYTINDALTKHGAINVYNDSYYLYLNKADRRKLHQIGIQPLQITIKADTSKYGAPMPEALSISLHQFPEAQRHFDNLTPGKQRGIIFMIGKIKSEALQINRCLALVEYLEDREGRFEPRDFSSWVRDNRKNLL